MMVGVWSSLRAVSVGALACACGNYTARSEGGSGGAGPISSDAGQAGVGSGTSGENRDLASGEDRDLASGEDGDGDDRAPPITSCAILDGKLAYGPIGEPWPWPLECNAASGGDSRACGVQDYAAFSTKTGHGILWRTGFPGDAPVPNLFSMNAGPEFEPGKPRALLGENAASDFQVAPAPSGALVSTCMWNSGPAWIWLADDLSLDESRSFSLPDVECELDAPAVLWTGERYLTAFTDERGLIIASFDKQGTLVGEETVSAPMSAPAVARFSKNADRVLLVFNTGPGPELRYRVLDLEGIPLTESEPLVAVGNEHTYPFVTTNGTGWWAVNDAGWSDDPEATLTHVSRNGTLRSSNALGALELRALARSSSGGSLLLARWHETDLHGHSFSRRMVIDDAGQVIDSVEEDTGGDGPMPEDIVVDPSRDLIVENRHVDGISGHKVVQEYGCLE
jgi:hypothetical protein